MSQRIYNGPAWANARLACLERDDWLCRIKGPKCKTTATEADHIIPWDEGGAWYDLDNLRSVCRPCHNGRKQKRIVYVVREQSTPSREW